MTTNIKSWQYCYALFLAVFFVAFTTKTFSWIYDKSFNAESDSWTTNAMIFAAILSAYIFIIFYVVFPKITKTYNRPWSLFSFVFMGLPMGACDALVLIFSYRIALGVFPSQFIPKFFVTFLLYLVSTGYFYAVEFNPKLAPEHRDPNWDLFKILVLSLSDFLVTLFGCLYPNNWLVVIVMQAFVLGGIISSMRFPMPFYEETEDLEQNKNEKMPLNDQAINFWV